MFLPPLGAELRQIREQAAVSRDTVASLMMRTRIGLVYSRSAMDTLIQQLEDRDFWPYTSDTLTEFVHAYLAVLKMSLAQLPVTARRALTRQALKEYGGDLFDDLPDD